MSKIIIKTDRCKGCGLCVDSCPQGLIKMSQELNAFGYYTAMVSSEEGCNSCSLCAVTCPDIAIEVYK